MFGEDKVRMADLFVALELDYQNNRRRSARGLHWRLAPLRAAFGEDRAIDVTEARIERYKADRLASLIRTRYGVGTRRVSPATVNRELAALTRAFRLAVRQKRLSTAPTIELLKEAAPRQGFLEPDAFERVVAGPSGGPPGRRPVRLPVGLAQGRSADARLARRGPDRRPHRASA